MPCTRPMQVYFTRDSQGTKILHFSSHETREFTSRWYDKGNVSLSISANCQILPCGKCKSCRLAHARMWSLRCYLESKSYEHSVMLNVTYAPEHVPLTEGLRRKTLFKEDYQKFLKKLRIAYQRLIQRRIFIDSSSSYRLKYFGAGEYGTKCTKRPHYHFCVFGLNLKDIDLKFDSISSSGCRLYTSKFIDDLWGKGRVLIGSVTMKSAGYIARYALKKRGSSFDKKDFERDGKVPEFICMSNGLGRDFFEKFFKNIYAIDAIVLNNIRYSIPRYFDKLLEKKDFTLYSNIKYERALRMYDLLCADDALPSEEKQTSYERMQVKEYIQEAKAKKLIRNYETHGDTTNAA